MKRRRLDELVPPGADGSQQGSLILVGLIFAVLLSCYLFGRQFSTALDSLNSIVQSPSMARLYPNARMTDFCVVLGAPGTISSYSTYGNDTVVSVFFPFLLLAIAAVILAVTNYTSFWRGSKSVYLMRRLPDRREFSRRCLALPLLLLAACVILVLLLTLIFYGVYIHLTPEEYIRPDQWKQLWLHFFELFRFTSTANG